jgi:hypothetical protein
MAGKVFQMRVVQWLQRGFRVSGIGLMPEQLAALRAAVRFDLDGQRVKGYSIVTPSGNAVFDRALRAHLDGLVGRETPSPPRGYDLELPNPLYAEFVCGKGCN